ncbi:hypothetical protein ZWY2020_019256 [Hordeum vulgare]|nr:hypothetical protein ZWY2020_019256 [Hordeum vulgare]
MVGAIYRGTGSPLIGFPLRLPPLAPPPNLNPTSAIQIQPGTPPPPPPRTKAAKHPSGAPENTKTTKTNTGRAGGPEGRSPPADSPIGSADPRARPQIPAARRDDGPMLPPPGPLTPPAAAGQGFPREEEEEEDWALVAAG